MSVLGEFDPIGIGETASLLIAGGVIGVLLLVIGFGIFPSLEGGGVDEESFDERRPLDEGVLLTQYLQADDLGGIAAQRNIVPSPAWVERGQARETSSEGGLNVKGLSGKTGRRRSSDQREHVEMPRDSSSLVPLVLKKLEDLGDLDREIASAPYVGSDRHPILSNPEETTKYINAYLDDRYHDGC